MILAVVFIAVIWGWFNWVTGKTLRGLTHQLEHHITLKVFTWLTGKPILPE
jgi:hypothetical protein